MATTSSEKGDQLRATLSSLLRIANENATLSKELDQKDQLITTLRNEILHLNETNAQLRGRVSENFNEIRKLLSKNAQKDPENSSKRDPENSSKRDPEEKSLLEIHLNETTYLSDKWEHYFHQYNRYFQPYRNNKDIRLLEIGVQNGGSLQCWNEYFNNNPSIVGIDINPKTSFLEYERGIKNYVGDATDPEWTKIFLEKEEDFTIIIDDGSHLTKDIIKTFSLFFGKIKPGGIYVCEDLHTAYWSEYEGAIPTKIARLQCNFSKKLQIS